MIACVLISHFAAAVERRDDPSLGPEPLIINRSGEVLAVSEGAARMGVRPGMRLHQARALCPQARFTDADQAGYQRTFEALLDTLESFTPLLEPGDMLPSAISWLDLGKLTREEMIETVQHIGRSVRRAISLAPAIGLACLYLRRRDPDAVVVILPADHVIGTIPNFQSALRRAVDAAADGHLVSGAWEFEVRP